MLGLRQNQEGLGLQSPNERVTALVGEHCPPPAPLWWNTGVAFPPGKCKEEFKYAGYN